MATKRNFSTAKKLEISKKYNSGLTSVELGKEYGLSHNTILSYVRQNGFKIGKRPRKRMYPINEKYFDIINTEQKAYFLGLLYADGCVTDSKILSIGLQEKDKEILEKMRNELDFKGKIHSVIRASKITDRIYNHVPMSVISVRSERLVKSLIKLGCIPRKSLKLKFPNSKQVPNRFIKAFVRGYFDGDGYVGITKHKNKSQIRSQITSTKKFLKRIKARLTILGIKSSIKLDSNSKILRMALQGLQNTP